MKLYILILCGLLYISLGAQQEVEINSDGIVLPRTDAGGEVEGTIRYNSDIKQFEGYNGTSWVRFNS